MARKGKSTEEIMEVGARYGTVPVSIGISSLGQIERSIYTYDVREICGAASRAVMHCRAELATGVLLTYRDFTVSLLST